MKIKSKGLKYFVCISLQFKLRYRKIKDILDYKLKTLYLSLSQN